MKKTFKTIILFCLILVSNNFFAQEDKVVELTTTGTGKTKDVAVHTALRSAIEQAFGVFISSKTEVLNDELLTDQIISVSNGNIQHYDIISEMPIDDNANYVVTVKSKVSISKLTSFIESKGIEVEFKGAVFAMNIKQQKLNEESELKAIKEMAAILKNIADRSFDFEVAANGEPTLSKTNRNKQGQIEKWDIPLTIKIKLNQNFENYKSYFQKTLSALTMSEAEAKNYINLKKPIYSVMLRNQTKIVDTLLIKSKVKTTDVIKNYLTDSMNNLQIAVRGYDKMEYLHINQTNFNKYALSLSQIPGYRKNTEEKAWKIYSEQFERFDTVQLKVISHIPLYSMYYLRNKNSFVELQKLVFYFIHSMQNFILDDGTKKFNFTDILNATNENLGDDWFDVFYVSSTNFGISLLTVSNRNKPVTLKYLKPYNESKFDYESYTLEYYGLRLTNLLPNIDLNHDGYETKNFKESGALFHTIFPGLGTIQYNCNEIIQNSSYNIVLQFNQLCDKDNLVAIMKYTDQKTLDELNVSKIADQTV
jgi:hypothetical protein